MELTKIELAFIIALIGDTSTMSGREFLASKLRFYENHTHSNAKFFTDAVDDSDICSFSCGDLWDKFAEFTESYNKETCVAKYLVLYKYSDGYYVSDDYYTDANDFNDTNPGCKFVELIQDSKFECTDNNDTFKLTVKD